VNALATTLFGLFHSLLHALVLAQQAESSAK
jgi:hypothetical protein